MATVAGVTVRPHELIVAAVLGAIMGVAGFYLTSHIAPPVERLVNKLGADADD